MTESMKHAAGYVEIVFGPRWKYIAVTRGYIQNFVAVSLENEAKADKIAMAVSELLENAVKYSISDEIKVVFRLVPDENLVRVVVENQTSAENAAALQEIYDRIMSMDPLEAYIEQMKIAATRSDGKSQLGIVRIRYEVGAEVLLSISPDYKVTFALEVGTESGGAA